MTQKKRRVHLMRQVRRATGLPLPVAARVARLFLRGQTDHHLFDRQAGGCPLYCDEPEVCPCCVSLPELSVQGPRGRMVLRPAGR